VATASAEAQDLRTRAERCRSSAREYASEIGNLLVQLAAELDLRADQIEAIDRGPGE
jgi:hypothetical protein